MRSIDRNGNLTIIIMEIILSKNTNTDTFTFESKVITDIAECEFQIGKMQTANKANTELKNSFKIKQYSEVITALAKPAYLKPKSQFFVDDVRKAVDQQLQDIKMSKASRKRMLENSNRFITQIVKPKKGSNYTPDAFYLYCKEHNLNSETLLKKHIAEEYKPSEDKDIFAGQIVGGWSTKKDDSGKIVQGDTYKPSKYSIEQIDEIINHLTIQKNARKKIEDDAKNSTSEHKSEMDNVSKNMQALGV